MRKNKNNSFIKTTDSFIANLFVAIAFTVVCLFLIGLLIIENVVANNEIIMTNYEILEYKENFKPDVLSPSGVKREYILDIGGMKNDEVTIAFFTKHQYSKVFIGDELVCSIEPNEDYQFTKTIGSNWVMFTIKKEESSLPVSVEIVPAYSDVFEEDIVFIKGSVFSIFYKMFVDNLPQIILGFSAIIIGLVFSIIAFYRKVIKKECYTIFMLGLFSLFLGTWRLFDSQFIPFVIPQKPIFIYYVIVTMLTISPIPFLNALKFEVNSLWKKIYNFLCIIIAIIAISQITLQVVYNIDVRKYLSIYHYFLITCLVIILISEIYHRIKKFKRSSIIHRYLPVICVIAVFLDLFLFYYTKNTSKLFFTICTFLFYIVVSGVLILREYAVREKILQNELKQSQITILLSQIQPHFIYNTLSSIRYLCKTDSDLAQKSIDDFSLYLRCNMDSLKNSDLIPFEKEMLFVETYVKLEQLRFGDKIKVQYDLKEKDFSIPSLTIQPLVENAIKHGVSVKENGGIVKIITECIDRDVIISIIDDGIGFNIEKQKEDKKTHIGITNVKNRLNYLIDSDFLIESSENGTKVRIILKNVKKGKK